ncbi:sensor histidine kinase [Cryptosporangium sp. NPDC051539]|uniref:sensor histidine kinase n=1 Tax=Cryptosporangium sp. NPDC051539 TaxID=3363962 RepID=UPI0037B5D0E5
MNLTGPFARWPRTSDALLALLLAFGAATLRDTQSDSAEWRSLGDVMLAVVPVIAVAAAALYFRRRAPLLVLGISLVGWALLLIPDEYSLFLIPLVALYSVAKYEPSLRRSQLGLYAVYAVLVLDGLVRGTPWFEVGFGVVVLAMIFYIGRQLQLREERAEQRRRQRADEARRIVAEERTHIARELHDVVAHQVSMMTVQAGAAQAVADSDPESARQAMAAVEQAGRQTLDELRHLLGVLRPETGRNGFGPVPGLTDLPRLIEQVAAAGLDVRLDDGLRTELPTRVQLSAYRIVQEALTNVLKHRGPGTRADVRLTESGGDVTIEIVDNAPPGPLRPQHSGGHGIIGMRERATLLGGTLEAGVRPEGGFRVVARFPIEGVPA